MTLSKPALMPRLLCIFALGLSACDKAESERDALPLSQKITWAGHPPVRVADSVPGDTADPGAPIRVHRLVYAAPGVLEFNLAVSEFRADHWAFSAWQRRSAGESPHRGAFRSGDKWIFAQGRYVGEADTSGSGFSVAALRENLLFAGESEFPLPALFASFPLLGRIPNRERVVRNDFLGHSWLGPVFIAEFQCHGDTALAFRAMPQSPESLRAWMAPWKGSVDSLKGGREWRFTGVDEFRNPMVFWVFPEGLMGFSGCHDPIQEKEYLEKMQKTQVFWHQP